MIRVRNIYHMLAYAFTNLKAQEYASLQTEEFEHAADLYAQILINGIRVQLKRGIVRSYEEHTEELTCVRGRILFAETAHTRALQRGRIICEHDDFTEDNDFNRILISVSAALLKTDITPARKKSLQHLLKYFPHVRRLPLQQLNWKVRFTRQSKNYRMLIGICKLVAEGLMQSSSAGDTQLMDFQDARHLNTLYEKFLLAYFQQTYKGLDIAARKIRWSLDEGDPAFLPGLRSDILIRNRERTLIIDAKYYSRILQAYYGSSHHHPHNLNQILNYVHQESAAHPAEHEVCGMLLYAGTDENVPDKEFVTCGKRIHIKVLDLNADFADIRATLGSIITRYFPHTQALR